MKRILLLFLVSFQVACAQERDYVKESEAVFSNIRNREFGKVTALFDTSFASRLDSVKLREVWDKLLSSVGPFVEVIDVNADHQPNYDVVIQKAQFEKKKIDFKIVYGTNEKIKGISFLPGEPRDKYQLPEYYDEKLLMEKPVVFSNGPVKLPGVLTLPKKKGPFPLVVLVHGSGPNDKDETVGPTKIFKDLSIGLANRGVAVYRYDKRTRIYKSQTMKDKKFTVWQETVDDAVAAIRTLRTDSLIDSTQVFVCGHSLGAMLLPRIAEKVPGIKGFIFLAANARPLEDNLLEQTRYVISLDTTEKDHTALLDSITRETKRIKALKPSSSDSTNIFFLPPAYWIDLNGYNQLKAAQAMNAPMLFQNGGRDYQVTEMDYGMWKKALVNKNAEFRMYPDLNHFFISGTEKSTPFEYNKKGNVDLRFINDMADWILAGKKQ